MNNKKIVSAEEFKEIRHALKKENKTVVMCHGVYDLLHYGHIEHLNEAKSYGDILVVSVTSAPFVNKGPDRPYFDDRQRTEFLANIECVDYVLLSFEATALTNIMLAKPDIYVKGSEFQDGTDGVTGQVAKEIEAVEKLGGVVKYTQGEVFSSSNLLNNYFGALPEGVVDYSHLLLDKYGDGIFDRIVEKLNRFENLKILVVGDIIIDEYVFCMPQGLTTKDSALSTRFRNEERYLGGCLAIARHLTNFCNNVEVLSMMGNSNKLSSIIEKKMPKGIRLHIIKDENFVTPVKRRYLKQHIQRKDNDKLFSINYINTQEEISKIDYEPFYTALNELLPQYDMVIVCDYGHGLIDEESIRLLEGKSRFLSLNCQTNSSNYGMNLITKYHRADSFVLDEREIWLAYHVEHGKNIELLKKLRIQLGSGMSWLTVGAAGALCSTDDEIFKVPALTLNVADTVGAGDAFFALSSLCAVTGVPADISTLLCNATAAIKTHIIGNKNSIKKKDLLKFVKTVLNV